MGGLDEWQKTDEEKKEDRIKEKIAQQSQVEKYKSSIKKGGIWDMRCWDKYKDIDEINKWLDNKCEPNNCGHVVYCIEELIKLGTTKSELLELILQNSDEQTFKFRKAKCFGDAKLCELYVKNEGNYAKCECGKICNGEVLK